MTGFKIGHRVVVREANGYDQPCLSSTFGPMAGHYGKVVSVYDDLTPPMIAVEIAGRVNGPVSPGIDNTLFAQPSRTWHYFPNELEHAD